MKWGLISQFLANLLKISFELSETLECVHNCFIGSKENIKLSRIQWLFCTGGKTSTKITDYVTKMVQDDT